MIHTGDCIEVMRGMPADSVDAVVTDPPYGLEFMGRSWDRLGDIGQASSGLNQPDPGPWGRQQRVRYNGSANKKCRRCGKWAWDHEGRKCECEVPDFPNVGAHQGRLMQEWHYAWAVEALRVTKPGGYLLAFGGTRTHHRLVCGLEDAGWIIRDELTWVYASGFPKGKANLKPAHEPIVLARKPGPLRPLNIEETRIGYSANELDDDPPTQEAGREAEESAGKGWWPVTEAGPRGAQTPPSARRKGKVNFSAKQRQNAESAVYVGGAKPGDEVQLFKPAGRWPSNLLLSDPELFDEPNPYVVGSGATSEGSDRVRHNSTAAFTSTGGAFEGAGAPRDSFGFADSGGYSRFFLVPKSSRADREPVVRGQVEAQTIALNSNGKPSDFMGQKSCGKCGEKWIAADGWPRCGHGKENTIRSPQTIARENAHPTVKPTDLMRHLVRLVTPSGGRKGHIEGERCPCRPYRDTEVESVLVHRRVGKA